MKALVTGANGFIGSKLVIALKNIGYELILLSRQKINNYETVLCNLGSDEIPEAALESVDIVFHLAGYTHDLENSASKNQLYYDVNVKSTIELMKISASQGVKNFIYLSSVKAGGVSNTNISMSEEDQITPSDIYGSTKRTAEIEILKIANTNNIAVSIIRPALVYGDEMKGNLAVMLKSIKRGWFPPLPQTGNKRSMISIIDVVDAILFISSNQKSSGEIYIATDGNIYSSRDIYNALCLAAGKKTPSWEVPQLFFIVLAAVGDIFRFIPFNSHKYQKLFGDEHYSSEKLNNLGFTPKYNFSSYLERNNQHTI